MFYAKHLQKCCKTFGISHTPPLDTFGASNSVPDFYRRFMVTLTHSQKSFRAVDFPRLCRGRKNVVKCFILHVTASYLQHVFNMLKHLQNICKRETRMLSQSINKPRDAAKTQRGYHKPAT